jgi:L-alanine-DL-glutamate epimerase-like enolase superfamily enzyme
VRVTGHRTSILARPRPHVVVTLVDDEGRLGRGEASPLPPFSREDAPACARALNVAGAAVCLDEIDDEAPPAEAVGAALRLLGPDLDGVPCARFALETALFDLIGQRRGLSIAACLGAPPDPAPVPVNALLLPDPLDTLADRAAALAAGGFPALKIKLRARDDAGFERELAALEKVRERLPAPYEIRLDPNAAWAEDLARRRLAALAPIAPSYVEQPVAADRLHRLGPCAVPWAADESLALPDLVEPLLSARGCAAFVVKPAILGGLLAARALVLRAQARGIAVVVTHLMDGPWALAAACELAVSLPSPPLACGLAPHDDLAAFVASTGSLDVPQVAFPPTIRSSGGPGLGVAARPFEHPWKT